jgi:hypothetical protein
MSPPWGGTDITLPMFNHSAKTRWVFNPTSRPLYHLKRAPLPIVQEVRLGLGPGLDISEHFSHNGVRTLDHSSHRESLYRLRCSCCRVIYVPSNNLLSENLFFILQTYTSVSSPTICLGCSLFSNMFFYNTSNAIRVELLLTCLQQVTGHSIYYSG